MPLVIHANESTARAVPTTDLLATWMVVRTKPHQERAAVVHLGQRGVEAYCPMFLEPPWHPRAPRGPLPMFTSYIFAECDPDSRLNAIRYCPGVAHPVVFDRRIATVDGHLIDALRMREGERGYILPEELHNGIRKGEKVRVMGGPLRGMAGVFRGYLRGRERAHILLEFLRTQRLVEVDAETLQIDRN